MSTTRGRRARRLAAVVAVAGLAVVPLARAHAAAPPSAVDLSRTPIAENAAWQGYVLEQGGRYAYPKAVHLVAGTADQVVNPTGLEAPGGGVTTITSTGPGTPRLNLDLGVDTGASSRSASRGPTARRSTSATASRCPS